MLGVMYDGPRNKDGRREIFLRGTDSNIAWVVRQRTQNAQCTQKFPKNFPALYYINAVYVREKGLIEAESVHVAFMYRTDWLCFYDQPRGRVGERRARDKTPLYYLDPQKGHLTAILATIKLAERQVAQKIAARKEAVFQRTEARAFLEGDPLGEGSQIVYPRRRLAILDTF